NSEEQKENMVKDPPGGQVIRGEEAAKRAADRCVDRTSAHSEQERWRGSIRGASGFRSHCRACVATARRGPRRASEAARGGSHFPAMTSPASDFVAQIQMTASSAAHSGTQTTVA